MASSLTSPALRFASNQAILTARKELAKVSMFSTNFTAEAAQPGSTLLVPIYNDGEADEFRRAAVGETPSNNYGDADGSVTFAPITFNHHLKKSFGFTAKDFLEFNSSRVWTDSGTAAGRAVARGLLKTVCAKINRTNVKKAAGEAKIEYTYANPDGVTVHTGLYFTKNNEVVVGGDWTKDTVAKTCREACSNADIAVGDSVLMVNGQKFGQILASLDAHVYGGDEAIRGGVIPNLFGFAAVIENEYLPADANEKLIGAIVPRDALAIASRVIPVQNTRLYDEVGTVTDDNSGLTMQVRRGGDWRTDDMVMTMECLFGSALLQPTKIVRLCSAATEAVQS